MKTFATAVCALLLFAVATTRAWAQGAVDRLYIAAHKAQDARDYEGAIRLWGEVLKLEPKDATAYFNRAVAYEGSKETEKALADYAMAIRLDPGDDESYKRRAELYENSGEKEKAVAVYTEEIAQDPSRQEAYLYRARFYAEKASELSQGAEGRDEEPDKEDWDKAVADYLSALELKMKGVDVPDAAAWAEKTVKESASTKDYNMAMAAACWSMAVKLDPKNPEVWLHRAATGPEMGDTAKAIADYSEAIRLDPKNVKAYWQRARLYLEEPRDAAKAIADFSEAIKLGPDKAAYIERAEVYNGEKDYDKAIADYNEAIRLGAVEEGYGGLADIHTAREEWDKAIADYTKLIEAGGDSDSYHNRAEIYYRMKDWDNVIADMDKAMVLDAKAAKDQQQNDRENGDDQTVEKEDDFAAKSLLMRGDAWAHKGMYDKALADFRRASAPNAEAWLLATCPDAKFRDPAKAVKLATASCLATGWVDADALDTLAAAEAETGKWDDAVKHEKLAVEVAGDGDSDADADEKEQNAQLIKEYAARLELYGKKKTFEGEKRMGW